MPARNDKEGAVPSWRWRKTLQPVKYVDESWTHVGVDGLGQVLLARFEPDFTVPVKVCRLAEAQDAPHD